MTAFRFRRGAGRGFLALLGILGTLLAAGSIPAAQARKPNILFVLVDDLGYGDLGCYGGVGVETANLDRLAREGTRFSRFYTASPICSPSRVGFTTGMFPARWRISSYLQTRAGNRRSEQADWLDPAAPSLARTLREAGYATGHFGKWHMGGGRDVQDAPLPAAYGFDESLVNSTPLEGMGPALPAGTPRWQTTGLFIDRALDFARRQKAAGKPFYVNLWFSEVHDAHVPKPAEGEAMQAENRAANTLPNFRRVLGGFDAEMGRLLAGLRELGIERDTLVLFTGDNGPQPLYDRARTAGLRGQKWSLYEGGIRQPLLARWPGRIPAGRLDQATVLAAVDFFPSLCALAEVRPPASAAFDGMDLSAALLGRSQARTRPLFWEYGRVPQVYLMPERPEDRSPNLAIMEGSWKLLINADGSGAELYDLAADARESQNLAAARPEATARLAGLATAWRRSLP